MQIHYYNAGTPKDYWCKNTPRDVQNPSGEVHTFSSSLRDTTCLECLGNIVKWVKPLINEEKVNETY